MSACEKCWGDAYMRMRFVDPSKDQAEHYSDLIRERKDNPCTPEQQAGTDSELETAEETRERLGWPPLTDEQKATNLEDNEP